MTLTLLQDIALFAIPHRSPLPNFPLYTGGQQQQKLYTYIITLKAY